MAGEGARHRTGPFSCILPSPAPLYPQHHLQGTCPQQTLLRSAHTMRLSLCFLGAGAQDSIPRTVLERVRSPPTGPRIPTSAPALRTAIHPRSPVQQRVRKQGQDIPVSTVPLSLPHWALCSERSCPEFYLPVRNKTHTTSTPCPAIEPVQEVVQTVWGLGNDFFSLIPNAQSAATTT